MRFPGSKAAERYKKGLSNLFMVYGDNGSICEKLGIAHRMLTGCGVVDI